MPQTCWFLKQALLLNPEQLRHFPLIWGRSCPGTPIHPARSSNPSAPTMWHGAYPCRLAAAQNVPCMCVPLISPWCSNTGAVSLFLWSLLLGKFYKTIDNINSTHLHPHPQFWVRSRKIHHAGPVTSVILSSRVHKPLENSLPSMRCTVPNNHRIFSPL